VINVVFTQAPTLVFGCVPKKIQVCGMCFFEKNCFWNISNYIRMCLQNINFFVQMHQLIHNYLRSIIFL